MDDEEDARIGIVYFGTILMSATCASIPFRSLRNITSNDLLQRSDEIWRSIGSGQVDISDELDLLYEYQYIHTLLSDRWVISQSKQKGKFGVFLSHSSANKRIIRQIAVDLANEGYDPWFDEWEIAAGNQFQNVYLTALKVVRQ